jgi:ketosteroid isomerase-like protein
LELYEPDALFEPEPGVVAHGHGEIRLALGELARLRPRLDLKGRPAVLIAGEVALVSNDWSLSASLPDGSILRQHGVSADVLRRQNDGSWRVLIDQPRGTTLVP